MKITWGQFTRPPGGPVHCEFQSPWFKAVTPEGLLVLNAPLPKANALRKLQALGYRPTFKKLPPIKRALAHGTAFQIKVWRACQKIPRGQTSTYGQLAQKIKCLSAQAIGHALGANLLAQIIPCHRVVSATGLGGFAWGTRLKRQWLQQEHVVLGRT